MTADDARGALSALHEAVLLPELWPDALARIARACGATSALAQMVGANGYAGLESRGSEEMVRLFMAEGWHRGNPRMEGGLRLTRQGVKGLITDEMSCTPELRAGHPFFQEFARAYEIEAEAARIVASHAGSHFILAVNRGRRRGQFAGAELERMNRLIDGFAGVASFALRLKLTAARQMLETFSARGEALALLSASGRILHMTPAMEAQARGGLLVRRGRIFARDPAEDARLQALIAQAGAWTADPLEPLQPVPVARAPLAGPPLVVRCMPVAGAARDFFGLARIVMAVDGLGGKAAAGTEAVLRSGFRLTPAEARLASRLGGGLSLRAAAEAEGVTFETARSRLKTVFTKTGTSRQAELALLVARLGA